MALSSPPLDATLLRENAPPIKAGITFVGEGFFELFELPMTLGSPFDHEQLLLERQSFEPLLNCRPVSWLWCSRFPVIVFPGAPNR